MDLKSMINEKDQKPNTVLHHLCSKLFQLKEIKV